MPAYTTRFIALNGAPGSGKTTIARELCRELNGTIEPSKGGFVQPIAITDSFAAPMKHFIATALGAQYHSLPKEAPRAELASYSVREFLIDLSENYIKPRYGEGIYGRWLVHRVGRLYPAPRLVICDDSGFEAEYQALGIGAAKLIRVTRPGRAFLNDSRRYLPDPDYVLDNNGDWASLVVKTKELAQWCMELLK